MTFAARSLGYLAKDPTVALSTTLTIGTSSVIAGYTSRGFTSAAAGANTPTTWGSLASATLTDGKTCVSCYDDRDTNTPMYIAVFSISGFSSDPGQGYLYDVTANGVTRLGSLTTTYSYSAGRAIWEWEAPTTINLFGFATTGTTTLTVRLP